MLSLTYSTKMVPAVRTGGCPEPFWAAWTVMSPLGPPSRSRITLLLRGRAAHAFQSRRSPALRHDRNDIPEVPTPATPVPRHDGSGNTRIFEPRHWGTCKN